jgi:hypothetical protein
VRYPWLCAAAALFAVTVFSQSAAAQTSAGVRAGVSGDPDQFYFGGHVETEPLVDRLRFRPNVEVGLGDDVTVVAFNLEFAYHFPSRSNQWNVYAGAGPALNVIDANDETDLGGGFNFLVGVTHDSGLFFEFKIGVVDSPELKFGVGFSF